MTPAIPPADSNQTLPTVFENRARENSNAIFAKIPISTTTYGSGFQPVTYLQVLNAINRVAWLFENHLGRSQDFKTLAYIGPHDLRYSIVLIAAIKAGYKTFLPSPRNSKAAHVSLLSRLQCRVIVTTSPELPCISMILEDYSMQKLQIPSLQELLNRHDVPHYPYKKNFQEAKKDPIFVLHTSGSTGIPKPMVYTHEFVTRIVNVTSLSEPEGFHSLDRFFRTGKFFTVLPSFHIAGIGFSLIIPAFHSSVPVYPLPGPPPTINAVIDALHNTELDWAFLPPVMIDELGKDVALLEAVAAKLKYLYYTGGSVPRSSGDTVSSRVPLYQVMGSSECAVFPLLRLENDHSCQDWNYIQIHPSVQAEFRHRFEDLYELVVVRKAESECYQPAFLHFPDLEEYETRDLFTPHSIKPGLWTHRSRIDDVIVFLNGEKTNPVSFEQEISRHPEVQSALVVGQQRFEASLLVELVQKRPLLPNEQLEVIERLWPAIQEANSQCPSHARVSKSKILLVDPAMPMLRAGKGTVQRQATLDLYSKKLDDLYVEVDSNASSSQSHDLASQSSVTQTICELVKGITEWKYLGDEDEFFSLGMESLQVLRLRRRLKVTFPHASITVSTIYANPSVDLLTKQIMKMASQNKTSTADSETTRRERITAMLREYENEIDAIVAATQSDSQPKARQPSTSHVIVLSGSTGALGSYMLQKLLLTESVAHIYCLNRSVNSQSIQIARNTEHCLPKDFPPSRVTFLTADLSKPDFGLEKAVYNTILSTTTQVIHNAWPVDFNQTLQSFRTSLSGVLCLISFAAHAGLSPSIFFLSSISSIINYYNTSDALPLVPEAIITDISCPAPMGYGESKYLAERMLDYASRKLHLTTGAVRIGQIAGTAHNPRGWNRNEWLPSLVLSSRYIGALPESLGYKNSSNTAGVMDEIDWVPIDQLADILVELAFALRHEECDPALRVFHAVNMHPITWKSLLPAVMEGLRRGSSVQPGTTPPEIKILSFKEWVDLLQSKSVNVTDGDASEISAEILRENPGMKLLGFYEGLLSQDRIGTQIKVDTRQTLKASQSLRNMGPIQAEWMTRWVENWVSGSK